MSFTLTSRVKQSAPLKALLAMTFLFVATSTLLLGFLYLAIIGLLDERLTTSVETDINSLMERYSSQGVAGLITTINNKIADDSELDDYYLLTTASHERIAGNIAAFPTRKPKKDGWIKTPHLLILQRILPTGEYLFIGRDTLERRGVRNIIFKAFLLTIALIVPMSFALALGFRQVLLRLGNTVDNAARKFAAGHLSHRITNSSVGEFATVGATLNRMFDRIEVMLEDIRHSTNAIAHDLRTPLTAIRLQIEQLRSAHPTTQMACTQLIQSVDRVIDLFNAHLRIAEIDAGARKAAFAKVDLDVVVSDAIIAYEGMADQKSQQLKSDLKPIQLWADADLVFQAICNLIDNAVKFAPHNSDIIIEIQVIEKYAKIIISDHGPGIHISSAQIITERFTRTTDPKVIGGTGLGLALVAAVAREHDGELHFADNRPGLRVSLDLKIGM